MAVPFSARALRLSVGAGVLAIFPGGARYEIAPVRGPGRLLALTLQARFVAPGTEGSVGW